MYKVFSLIIVASIFAMPIYSQQIFNLPDEFEEDFQREMLFVGTLPTAPVFVNMDPYKRTGFEPSSKWVPFQGPYAITEHEFYEIAGYSKEAARAMKFEKTTRGLYWGGLGASVAGLAMSYGSMAIDPHSPAQATLGISGLTTTLGGLVVAYIGAFRMAKKASTAGEAIDAADDYNRALAEGYRDR